jgi:putative membrane protein
MPTESVDGVDGGDAVDAAQEADGAAGLGALGVDNSPTALLAIRSAIGGVLMGLANLVPGISGGTMLLAAGVYPAFISGIAELSTLRFRMRSMLVVGTIAATAGLAILLLAGLMKSLVVEQRWIMYSLFIGLTLGGVPLVWKLAQPIKPAVWVGAAAAFGVMLLMQLVESGDGGGSASTLLLLVSGLAGASAMILPGVSGGYLLLLLGQYETILGAVDQVKQALLGEGGVDIDLLLEAAWVVGPVGIGVVIGVVGVSNLLKWLMSRYEKATLGTLLGLLFGAVVGLWPFQMPVTPQPGEVIRGQVVSEATVAEIDVEHWRLERFSPDGSQVASAGLLVALGFGATMAVARIGRNDE